jgi:signal transduction histidine kinase/DNA-binding response OmpR family regulator/HPt (histidine-containing phosphotransfer) domain-containing protein
VTDDHETGVGPVLELLTQLAYGEFEARGEPTGVDDDLDAVITGINMLAEELGAFRDEMEQLVATRTSQLEAARAEALESTRLKSEFLATMSHEIRTPMNGVIGLTNLLLRTSLDETQHQYAQGVKHAGDALLLIINDILDFSKLEAGMVNLELIDFDPRELVEGVSALVALASARKDLELIGYCTPAVPIRLVGDEGRLRQILLNLASNAVKFTDRGEVVISVRAFDTEAGQQVRFQVSDTGIGIKPEDQGRLFQSFTQADASTTRRFGGTGLGLAISRRLTEVMGGQMGLESEEGVGSTFWFEVPLPVATTRRVTLPLPRLDVLAGARVLVVDDNATNRIVLQAQLAAWGMRPDLLAYPKSAVPLMMAALAAGDPYAVAVLDMHMPDLDGVELARLICAEEALGATRMIMLSSGLEVDRQELRRAGVQEWLSKPVRSSEFFDRLMRLMSPAPLAVPVRAAVAPGPVAAAKGRVLIVEDNALNQLVAEGTVQQLGYQVDIVGNGAEALDAVAATRYVAVLMDCHMPVMDGLTATAEIRRREGDGPRLPIIAMTAAATSEDRDLCLAAGMDDYVSKPVDANVLDKTLDRWVRQRRNTVVPDPVAAEPRNDLVLDPAQLSMLRGLGPDDGWGLLPAVAEAFLEMGPAIATELRAAHTNGNNRGVREAAHQIKGAAANVGAVSVAALSSRIELVAAATGTVDVVLMDQLQDELDAASRLLRAAIA